MKVLWLDTCEENNVENVNVSEFFECNGGSWKSYIQMVNDGNERCEFDVNDVDKKVFVVDDGGELFRLKDGRYVNVCWRWRNCAVWFEDDEDKMTYMDKKLGLLD